jgi:hypothetical protein
MLRKSVGRFLSTVVSNISAKQIEVGGAVKACIMKNHKSVPALGLLACGRAHLQTQCREGVVHLHGDDMYCLVLTADSLQLWTLEYV